MSKKKQAPFENENIELVSNREEFIETFFQKGAELTSELIQEVEDLRAKVDKLSRQNSELSLRLASDDAIRDLLTKIEALEKEKMRLYKRMDSATQENMDYMGRYKEMEKELDTMANLYVCSYQLHAALETSEVLSVIEQMLMQFIGAKSFSIFLTDKKSDEQKLVPVHAFHCDEVKGTEIKWNEGPIGEAAYTKLNYVGDIEKQKKKGEPLACIPIVLGETTVGVIAIYDLLEQKKEFVEIDYELFRLLALHSASAIIGAGLLARAGDISLGVSAYDRI